jgi:hypothetical protein
MPTWHLGHGAEARPRRCRVIQTPNNANNGIKYHAGRLLATYEAGVTRQRIAKHDSAYLRRADSCGHRRRVSV